MEIKLLTFDSNTSAEKLGYPTYKCIDDYAYKFDKDIVIRWGNSRSLYTKTGRRSMDFKHVINSSASIKKNCQKNDATKILARVVNVPTLWEKSVPAGILAVVRPMEHAAGDGFSVKKGPFNLTEGTYATRYIQTDAEYRVWFCGNRTILGRRVKMQCNETEKYPCRSKWGYEFCRGISKSLHNQTLLAAKVMGLDCGAADVLFSNDKWYFLELNSAPSVDHRIVREFFQIGLKELLKRKFPKMAEEISLVPVVEIKPQTESTKIMEKIKKKALSKSCREVC